MRQPSPPKDLFIENRRRLVRALPAGSLAILHANDIYPTNADGVMNFVQSSDLYYLTGVDQEETVLILFPDAPDEKMREMLFLRETSEHISIWEGEKLTREQAAESTGIPLYSIHWLDEFDGSCETVMCRRSRFTSTATSTPRAAVEVESRELRFVRRCRGNFRCIATSGSRRSCTTFA